MDKQLIPNGDFAIIQGHKLHIYRIGNKQNPKIIVMSGSMVPSPVCEYKVLYEKLSSSFRVIVIEKFGYGYSDLYECSCNIDALVDMQKEALENIGETGPFILLSHSMSGLEAIRWKQKYPEDIHAIIGLDMAMPEEYQQWSSRSFNARVKAMKMLNVLRESWLLPLYPLNRRSLSKTEISQLRLLTKRNLVGVNITNEAAALLDNANIVANAGYVDCPTLLFVSNGKQVSKTWIDSQRKFAEQMKAEAVYFNCGHCIHYYESEAVSKRISEFVKKLG